MLKQLKHLLQKLERLTHTDLTYLTKGGFWLITTQIILVLSGLISSSLFARLVPAADYGIYRYLLSIYGLFSIFTLPGVKTAMTRSVSQNKDAAVPLGTNLQVKTAFLGSMLSLMLSGWYFWHGNTLLSHGTLIVAFFLPLTDTYDLAGYFQGRRLFSRLSIYSSSTTVGSMIAVAIGIALGAHPLALLALFLGSIALIRISYFRQVRQSFLPLSAPEMRDLKKDLFTFGTKLSLLSTISIISLSLDKILLFHYLDPVSVAQYSFATSLPNQMRGLVRHLGTLALPKFSQRPAAQAYPGLLKRIPLLAGVIAIMIGGYALVAPLAFKIFFPAYLSIVPYSQLFCLSILDSITYPISSAFAAYQRTRLLSVIMLGTALSQIGLLFILIPLYGLKGAIMAGVSSRLITASIGCVLLYRENYLAKQK